MKRGLLLLAVPLFACAPARGGDPGSTPPDPSNDFQTALFTVVQYGDLLQYDIGNLVLMDLDADCEDLRWDGALDTWSMPEGVSWVSLMLLHGRQLDSWRMEYPAWSAWAEDDGVLGDTTAYFSGEMGEGPAEDSPPPPVDGGGPTDPTDPGDPGDEDDSTDADEDGAPPPEDPVDLPADPDEDPDEQPLLASEIGVGPDGRDDVLTIDVSTDSRIAGELELADERIDFSALRCPVVQGDVPVPGDDEPSPGGGAGDDGSDPGDDSGGSVNSGGSSTPGGN